MLVALSVSLVLSRVGLVADQFALDEVRAIPPKKAVLVQKEIVHRVSFFHSTSLSPPDYRTR